MYLFFTKTMTDRIIRTLTLSYIMTADMPVSEFSYPKPADKTSGVTLIPGDLTLLDEGMNATAAELAPLIAKKRTADFTFEYVSEISEQPNCYLSQNKVPMKVRFWRQVQSAIPIQNAVKLCVKTLKKEGAYAEVSATPTNELTETMFAFKVLDMMTSCGMEPLAEDLVSYIGVGKTGSYLHIDSSYKTGFGGGFREFNFGCVVLKWLNDSLTMSDDLSEYDKVIQEVLMRGRYVANPKGWSIIQSSTVLRRSPRIRGPSNCGNPMIGENRDNEVLYEVAGYWYEYGMYGSPDTGLYMRERDDQDAVVEFPVE